MPWKSNRYKEQRWKFIQEFLRNKSGLAEQCRRWAISRKKAYKWIQRFLQDGLEGLQDKPPGPYRQSEPRLSDLADQGDVDIVF